MPKKWTPLEEREKYKELLALYVRQHKTIFEIGRILGIEAGSVYWRLMRFKIPIRGSEKSCHNARILHVPAPSGDLAEYCGVMLGDGCIGRGQFFITVNIKTDSPYVSYLQDLLEGLFDFRPRVTAIKGGSTVDLYITSTLLDERTPDYRALLAE